MLALTGVDIQLDDDTYKSTYQILLEISKVWGRLDDLSRSSVLEQLFGKRQANIGAAILENGDLLERVYKTSEGSMGSAMREQEEYAKSIQYSIDTLNAAYQDFADSVINSDFVKNLLGIAQSFLEVLTKIIDKFGALPTILTGIAAIGGFKGAGLFGNLNSGLGTILTNLGNLKQVLNYDFGKTFKSFNINLKGLDAKDIDSLQQYVNLLDDANATDQDFLKAMGGMSDAAKAQTTSFNSLNLAYKQGVISQEQYTQATRNLSLMQKTATGTTKALSVALNVLGNVAIMVAINLAIKGISALVDKLIITRDELNEVRDTAVESSAKLKNSVDELVEESNAVDELVVKYKEINSAIGDTSESKDELLEIQNNLVDTFGDEAKGIDLVNGKYDEQIAKIKELSDAQYEEWKRQNAAEISRAEKASGYNFDAQETAKLISTWGSFATNKFAGGDELATSLYVIKDLSKDIYDILDKVEGVEGFKNIFGSEIFLSGDLEQARDQLGLLIDEYSRYGDRTDATLDALTEHYKALNAEIQNTQYYMSEMNKREAPTLAVVGEIDTKNLDKLKIAIKDTRESMLETFKDVQSGFNNTVDPIVKAYQSLFNGDALSSSDFWGLIELDKSHILTDIQMVGDKFVVNQEQLIQLKDEYINQQIDSLKIENDNLVTKQKDLQATIELGKAELSLLGARGMANAEYRAEYQAARNTLQQAEKTLSDYGERIKYNNILIDEWRNKLGRVVDDQKRLTEEIKKAQDYADNLLKAQEYRIDQIIDSHEAEKKVLEDEKQALQDELDVLNDQKDAIEEIIENYDTVNNYIQKVVKDEIDAVKEQQKAIEDSYNKRIEALKAENEEREDALEYAQKLANLENARNNKRRVLDETRGWRYESVKEDVVKAQNDLADFETSREIKALEKERDKEVAVYDDIIERKEKYLKQWEDIPDVIKDEQDELLAQELFGADVRERVTNEDISLLETFDASYRKHNTDLRIITGTEIKLKQAAIDAKDAEIKSKDEQINKWKAYKTEVQNAAKDIKDATEDYVGLLNTVTIDENSSLETRTTNLNNFKDAYSNALQTAIDLQNQLDSNGGSYEYDVHVNGLDELKQAAAASAVIAATAGIVSSSTVLGGVTAGIGAAAMGGMFSQTADDIVDVVNQVMNSITGFSSGGVADYTGMAMLHGRKNAPETIFNATDSAKLYELVHNTPNLMADVIAETRKIADVKAVGNSNTTNSSLSIGAINVYANNPTELSRGLDKELDKYFRTKLTQSYTQK